MYISTFSLNYNLFHKYKYYTYSNYNNNNFNKKIIAKHLLSKYCNIKRNKRHMWSNYWLYNPICRIPQASVSFVESYNT